jgi:hypothetical protein
MADTWRAINFFMSPQPIGKEVWSQQLTMNWSGIASGNLKMIGLNNS